jgi:hypothetical protein
MSVIDAINEEVRDKLDMAVEAIVVVLSVYWTLHDAHYGIAISVINALDEEVGNE